MYFSLENPIGHYFLRGRQLYKETYFVIYPTCLFQVFCPSEIFNTSIQYLFFNYTITIVNQYCKFKWLLCSESLVLNPDFKDV